jgi:3-deoxy-D-manno-octulosonic-acid transferase
VTDVVRATALRATVAALVQAPRGRAHPRWRKFLRETWGRPCALHRGRPVVWLVCAAGGEVVQAAGLGPALREALPDATLVASTTNHAFLDVAHRIPGLDGCFYTPWDLRGPCARALAAVRPDLLVSVECAWNPVLFRAAHRRGIRTMLASGTMIADYHEAGPYRRPMRRRVLDTLALVGVKDAGEVVAFGALGVPEARIRVLGDLRLDPAFYTVGDVERAQLAARAQLGADDCVVVAGSIHADEEAVVLDATRALRATLPDFRLVIAPRFLGRVPAIEAACAARGLTAARFTQGGRRGEPGAAVVILDTYGDLRRVYALARYVVLGGSFVRIGPGLGQNLVEPLAQGVPVLFGPHMRRWRTAVDALTGVFARLSITTAEELVASVLELEKCPDVVAALRQRARGLLTGGEDAVARHVDAIVGLLGTRGAVRESPR